MSHPLVGAYLKVGRARQHLELLDRERQRFTETDPYRLEIEHDPQTGHQIVRFRCDGPFRVPMQMSMIAGDAIHNLRSALDHVVYRLALAGGGTGERSQFPIIEDAKDYWRQEGRLLKGVVKGQRAIIEALQPYHVRGATEPLHEEDPRALNIHLMVLGRLDNMDKHRLLLAGAAVSPFTQPRFSGVVSAKGSYPASWIRVQDGAEYFRITEFEMLPGVSEMKVESNFPYTIGFGDPEFGPLGQANDIWADRAKGFCTKADLTIIADIVERIIGTFIPYFEGAHDPSPE